MKAKAYRTKSALYIPKYSGAMLFMEFLRDNPEIKFLRVFSDMEMDNGDIYIPVKLSYSSDEKACKEYINNNI